MSRTRDSHLPRIVRRREYTKAFEDYWSRSAQDIGSVELWQSYRIKHMTWLAWQAGRKRLKEERANG